MSAERILRALVLALVVLLVGEGLLRKAVGQTLSTAIFFLKDFLVIAMLCILPRCQIPLAGRPMMRAYCGVCVLFIPVVVATALRDPVLSIFGVKQYLLYPVVGMATFAAFASARAPEIARFCRRNVALLVPTALLAIAQLKLSPQHWLNLSVGGDSVEAFAAGGRLRVSSSFPFVAQFCMFLNAQTVFLCFVFAFFRYRSSVLLRIGLFATAPLFVVATFVTGSRGSVVTNLLILAVGAALAMLRGRASTVVSIASGAIALTLCIFVARAWTPEAFEAYDARVQGTVSSSHNAEIVSRAVSMLTDWTGGLPSAPSSFLGYGLGVMSNGSERVSAYAREWRRDGMWTETDLATILFEGGYYLVFLWMGFRIFVVVCCGWLYWSVQIRTLIAPCAFAMAYILIVGISGPLGIQPPLAIWWWIVVGLLAAVAHGSAMAVETLKRRMEAPVRESALELGEAPANTPFCKL